MRVSVRDIITNAVLLRSLNKVIRGLDLTIPISGRRIIIQHLLNTLVVRGVKHLVGSGWVNREDTVSILWHMAKFKPRVLSVETLRLESR